jgi:hypothetical protein
MRRHRGEEEGQMVCACTLTLCFQIVVYLQQFMAFIL